MKTLHILIHLFIPAFLALSVSVSASAEEKLSCDSIFKPVMKNEPALKLELRQLKRMCHQEANTPMKVYWSCLQIRLKKGEANFERFMLSAQVCNEMSLAQN